VRRDDACVAAFLAIAAAPLEQSAAQQPDIPVQAGATLERDTVTVGDVFRLAVRVHAPKGATINFPTAVDSLGPVQALEPPSVRDGSDTARAADRIAVYRMAAWDVGRFPIALGDAVVQTDAGDRRVTLELPSIVVRTVLPKDTALRVPKPARPLIAPRAPMPWWWWALGALAALLVAGIARWWARRRARAPLRTGDPYLDARKAFERIERLRLIEAGEFGRYAALMTDVVRRYLSERLEDVTLAMTTRELLAAARGAPTVSFDQLEELLEAVDPIKFAAAALTADRARALGATAQGIVRDEHDRAEAARAVAAPTERAA